MVEEGCEVKSEVEVRFELDALGEMVSDPWVEGARWSLGWVLGENDE